jgi:hypothetical protein
LKFLLYRKLKFLKKLQTRQQFYNKFLKRYNYKFMAKPKKTLLNSIKMKYLTHFRRKKNRFKNKQRFYFNYLTISNLIKKIRLFHDSFFINKPSEYNFVRRLHLYNEFTDSDKGY